jgi:hypothetical protein
VSAQRQTSSHPKRASSLTRCAQSFLRRAKNLYRYRSKCNQAQLSKLSHSNTESSAYLSGLLNLLDDLLSGTLSLVGDSLDGGNGLLLELLGGLNGRAVLAALPQEDTGNLNGTNTSEEEVDSGKPVELCWISICTE